MFLGFLLIFSFSFSSKVFSTSFFESLYRSIKHSLSSKIFIHENCPKVPNTLNEYPSFIIGNPNNENENLRCQIVNELLELTSKNNVYYEASLNVSIAVHMSDSKIVEYNGTNHQQFVKDYSLMQFGDWPIVTAVQTTTRRIALVVYNNITSIDDFTQIADDYADTMLFGKLPVEVIRKNYGKQSLSSNRLPALVITNTNHTKYLLLTNIINNTNFRVFLDKVNNGIEDFKMFKDFHDIEFESAHFKEGTIISSILCGLFILALIAGMISPFIKSEAKFGLTNISETDQCLTTDSTNNFIADSIEV